MTTTTRTPTLGRYLMTAVMLLALAPGARTQGTAGEVMEAQLIGPGEGGFAGTLFPLQAFGSSAVSLGDLDGDGVSDLVVGALQNDSKTPGSIFVLFLNADGTVRAQQEIGAGLGGFQGVLEKGDWFGSAVENVGDLNGDGIVDIAVGATGADDGGDGRGAVWLLHLRRDGTVLNESKISATAGGFTGVMKNGDRFGDDVTCPGDIDGDGIDDLVVGASFHSGMVKSSGAVWVLFLRADGTVRSHQKITNGVGGFEGRLGQWDTFGTSVTTLRPASSHQRPVIVVGAPGDDAAPPGGNIQLHLGALWFLELAQDGTVIWHKKLNHPAMGIPYLFTGAGLGNSVSAAGDIDGDGVGDLLVGAPFQPVDGPWSAGTGAIWILFLDEGFGVKRQLKIGQFSGGLDQELHPGGLFGSAVCPIGDMNGDGVIDIVVGNRADDVDPTVLNFGSGAVWVLYLNAGTWTDLGGGLPGEHGIPQLSGVGSQVAGEPATLELVGARARARTMFVAGFSEANLPFFGGILVPSPDRVDLSASTDGTGALTHHINKWPRLLPAGTPFTWQVWVDDPAAPGGAAGSNALRSLSP